MKVPGLRLDGETVGGLVFFGRMLDKIRLHAAGKLPDGYNLGTGFDGRLCTFLGVEYAALSARALAGGTDEELLAWAYAAGRRPSDQEIMIFNAWLLKRGWRDESSENIARMKQEAGWADRDDIQTYADFHRAEEA